MGIGFNSIYHITDSPSFITGDKYIILDSHRWYFNGDFQSDFVKTNLAEKYPDQFAPFKIPHFKISCDEPFKGTLFRYPLRTDTVLDISKRTYKPEEILKMFHKFYEKESIDSLLFLKYIEQIFFYELKEDVTESESLYTIELKNANQVQEQCHLIIEKIVPIMNLLRLGELKGNNHLTLVIS